MGGNVESTRGSRGVLPLLLAPPLSVSPLLCANAYKVFGSTFSYTFLRRPRRRRNTAAAHRNVEQSSSHFSTSRPILFTETFSVVVPRAQFLYPETITGAHTWTPKCPRLRTVTLSCLAVDYSRMDVDLCEKKWCYLPQPAPSKRCVS